MTKKIVTTLNTRKSGDTGVKFVANTVGSEPQVTWKLKFGNTKSPSRQLQSLSRSILLPLGILSCSISNSLVMLLGPSGRPCDSCTIPWAPGPCSLTLPRAVSPHYHANLFIYSLLSAEIILFMGLFACLPLENEFPRSKDLGSLL